MHSHQRSTACSLSCFPQPAQCLYMSPPASLFVCVSVYLFLSYLPHDRKPSLFKDLFLVSWLCHLRLKVARSPFSISSNLIPSLSFLLLVLSPAPFTGSHLFPSFLPLSPLSSSSPPSLSLYSISPAIRCSASGSGGFVPSNAGGVELTVSNLSRSHDSNRRRPTIWDLDRYPKHAPIPALPVCLSSCLSVCLPVLMPEYQSAYFLCVSLLVCLVALYIYPSVCLLICLTVDVFCLQICLFIYLPACNPFCLYVCLSVCMYIIMSLGKCICLPVCLSICTGSLLKIQIELTLPEGLLETRSPSPVLALIGRSSAGRLWSTRW